MDLTLHPHLLRGQVDILPSKSFAHRALICAALADGPTTIHCPQTSADMEATADCLAALGADIQRTSQGFQVTPIRNVPKSTILPCRESGSTLRFLLPVVGALGVDAVFQMEGRLPQRPLSPLWEVMEGKGCKLSRESDTTLRCTGKLQGGSYRIDGGISSQYVTGFMLAMTHIPGEKDLQVTGTIESQPYIQMTRDVLALFGGNNLHSPGNITIEADWSNAAFFLTANALGSGVIVSGLKEDSSQGDRAVAQLLPLLAEGCPTICARDIPDLVPILSVAAAANHGAVFTGIHRLRLKESDRVSSVTAMIQNLGGRAEATEDTITIYGTGLTGGVVDSHSDHRIAMSAAIAATVCKAPVTILGAQCVEKSYPTFWEEYARLGGQYEQYLR